MEITKKEIKERLYELGADLCGIAGVDRFGEAPEGYHPLDVLPSCQSVIVFACRFPAGTLACKTCLLYTSILDTQMKSRQDFQEMTQEECFRNCLPGSIRRKNLQTVSYTHLLFGKAAGGKKAVNRGKELFISGFAIVDFDMGAAAQVVQQVGPVPQKRRRIEGIFKKCGIGSRIHIKLFPVGRKVIPIDAAADILQLCD